MPSRSGPKPAPRADALPTLLVSIGLAAAVLALYAQTAHFEFVSLDDLNFLVDRPIVRRGLSWEGLTWALRTVDPNWHPLTWLTHQLDFSLFGADAGPPHLVSAGLHAVNAVLCLLALRALSGELWPSALVAALFALHPMRAESVAWLSERKDVTAGLFWMLTLLAYAAYARRRTGGRYALVGLALALGLMSKTMLVSLPFILALLDVWPLGRWRFDGRGTPPAARRALIVEKLPLLALAAAASAMTVFTQATIGGVRSLDQITVPWRLVNAALAAVTYIAQTVWPTRLAVTYSHPALLGGSRLSDYVWWALGAFTLLVAVGALCWAARRRAPYLAVGWLWYLIALLPVIGLMQVGRQGRADRYTYLPMIGVYIMAAWGLRDAVARWPRARTPAVAGTAAVLGVLAALSWQQIGSWRNTHTLFEHAVAVTDDNYFAHQTLAATLRSEGALDAARQHLEAALRISPDSAYAHEQLGLLLDQQGDRDGAAREYERALQLSERSYYARRSLAVIRRAQGRHAEEIVLLSDEIQYEPDNPQLRFDLGTALLGEERYADAAVQLQRAVELAPGSIQAHNNLGVALAKQNRFADAAVQFERVLALNPNHAMAARSLAWVREQMGQP